MPDTRDRLFLRRFIPLPRHTTITWDTTATVKPGRLAYRLAPGGQGDPRMQWIETMLSEYAVRAAAGAEGEAFLLELMAGADGRAPDHRQGYAVEPILLDGRYLGLTIVATTVSGLVHAAYTLRQLFLQPPIPAPAAGHGMEVAGPPQASPAGLAAAITIPLLHLTDYPAIDERGQWGGNTHDEVPWTSQWKLNHLEESAGVHYEDGKLRTSLSQDFVDEAFRRGATVVPYIPHLETIAKRAGLLARTDVTGTPDPHKPLPPEYIPGLCLSSPATQKLIEEWLERLAGYRPTGSVEVWLSEGAAPCYCDRCRGHDPFVLEMEGIQHAFASVRRRHPELRLRILLTQGSYPANELVLEAARDDVEITYYDGGRTYDSSHAPMIYPLLEAYSQNGGWLGVYPQITHCWRTVFPFTGPQLIASRAREFAEKGLRNVVGYAVPTNRHHEFNVTALAEWSWNPEGRDPYEFAAAYAAMKGFPNCDAFAAWAVTAGEAGWWLAESRMLLRLCYDYRFFQKDRVETEDHRFEFAGFKYDRHTMQAALVTAEEALRLSAGTGVEWTRLESRALVAGLEALLWVDEITEFLISEPQEPAEAGTGVALALAGLDRAAAEVSAAVSAWGEQISRQLHGPAPYTAMMRMRDTANVLLRLADALRDWPPFSRLPDEGAEYREKGLSEWSRASFDAEGRATFDFDVTAIAAGAPGAYHLCLTHTGGDLGGNLETLEVAEVDATGKRTVATESVDAKTYIGNWERWHDVRIDIPPAAAGSSSTLRLDLAVELPQDRAGSAWDFTGTIGLRRAAPSRP
ncbi:hypothetical protein ACFL6X_02525 [Candidatus Latescibacterota bacterium]